MQTTLLPALLETAAGQEADEILRNCVHCGFCNATCPTYQLTGDELDGPRGRIYLIKQVLEGAAPTRTTQLHLDRCLTCRACETTCPSGVDYHRLLDTGRELIEQNVKRPLRERFMHSVLRALLPRPARFKPLLRMGQAIRPLLPAILRQRIPAYRKPGHFTATQTQARNMLLLEGCVQPSLAPQINMATRRVLDALGINTVIAGNGGCCGAVSHHLGAPRDAKDFMRNNIDAWWPAIEQGAEAIVITASGCAPMVKEYARLLADDPAYADMAARVSALAKDVSEIIAKESPASRLGRPENPTRVAFHSPCTLQHGQGLDGVVETILKQSGYELTAVANSHLCCGSAGTYSVLQPVLANRLRDNKLDALQAGHPDLIATANIGCLMHMQPHAGPPMLHWIELLEALIPEGTA
jgi:glycolate oxidase iron-sulfur subunit